MTSLLEQYNALPDACPLCMSPKKSFALACQNIITKGCKCIITFKECKAVVEQAKKEGIL